MFCIYQSTRIAKSIQSIFCILPYTFKIHWNSHYKLLFSKSIWYQLFCLYIVSLNIIINWKHQKSYIFINCRYQRSQISIDGIHSRSPIWNSCQVSSISVKIFSIMAYILDWNIGLQKLCFNFFKIDDIYRFWGELKQDNLSFEKYDNLFL